MRNNSNFYSFLFTGILLASVLLSKTDSDTKINLSYQDSIKNTSLTASVQTIAFSPIYQNTSAPAVQINNAALKTNSETEQKPIKKNGVKSPALSANIAFAKDLENGKELFNYNAEKPWAIASITKLMTAIIALEKMEQKTITISQTAMDVDDSMAGNFSVGEKYSLKDSVKIMLLISSNKAATAISEFYGQENFINEMNLKAKNIGMSGKFYDCAGLDVRNQFTTDDLSKLTAYIFQKRPEIFDYTKLKEISAIELQSNSAKIFANINYFAGREDFLGGKTGTIDSSGENLLSLFDYKEHKILIIILGSKDRFSDTENLLNWIKKSYEF